MNSPSEIRPPQNVPRPSPSRRAKIAAIAVLTVVVPLLFLFVVEAVIRLAGFNTELVSMPGQKIQIPVWASQDRNFFIAQDVFQQIKDNMLPAEAAEWLGCFRVARDVQYKLKPDSRFRVSNTVNRMELKSGLRVVIESNREGFRTRNLSKTKRPGVFRILFLGDSTTFGWGVEQDERFSDLLEKRLNAAGTGICYEIVNLGLPGYSSYQGRIALDLYGLGYSPDMVILSFGANDSREVPKVVKRMIQRPNWKEKAAVALSGLKTARLLQKIMITRRNPMERIRAMRTAEGSEPFVTLDEFRANLKSIIEVGRRKGIETVILPLCCPLDYLAAQSALAKRENVRIIDGTFILLDTVQAIQQGQREPALARHYEELYGMDLLRSRRLLYVTNDTCHPNILGHRILADALFDRIFRERLGRLR
ncbi:MAG: GDSL-type esterase/lipase family protein [Candidatus Aminicenantes bacterium]|nr:GDSL-type esterase/lipase family protein [Candidatus Aminicenantes bacterium]